MESCISYIYPHTRVQSVIGILRTTAHNAFPVVTVDKPAQQKIQESNFQASFGSSNERFAHSTTFSSLISEQKLLRHISNGEDNISLLRSRTGSGFPLQSEAFDIKRKRFKSENSKDQLMYSTSSPGLSSSIDSNPSRTMYDLDDDEDDKDGRWDACYLFLLSQSYNYDYYHYYYYYINNYLSGIKISKVKKGSYSQSLLFILTECWVSCG